MVENERRTQAVAVRRPHEDETPEVVATLAEAFLDDPVTSFLLHEGAAPGHGRRGTLVAALFANRLLGGIGIDKVLVADAGERIASAAVWVPPRSPDNQGPDYTKVGLVNRLALGEEVMNERLIALVPMFELTPKTPHWYLAFVGTRPSARAQGLASALIEAVTTGCDAEGVGAYLESSDPANVPLYERHGFEVTAEISIEGGPTVPVMWREPAAS